MADIECRYVGFEIPNRFAIGYGLDYGERYRSLPYVAALDESERARESAFAGILETCSQTASEARRRTADARRRNPPW